MRFQKSASVLNFARMHTRFYMKLCPADAGYSRKSRFLPQPSVRRKNSQAQIFFRMIFPGRDRLLTNKRPVDGEIRGNKQ